MSPYIYIILELLAIAVMLFFIVRWGRLRRLWKEEQEAAARKEQDQALDRALSNNKRAR